MYTRLTVVHTYRAEALHTSPDQGQGGTSILTAYTYPNVGSFAAAIGQEQEIRGIQIGK